MMVLFWLFFLLCAKKAISVNKRYPSTESLDSKRKSSFFLKYQEDLAMLIPDDEPTHLKTREINSIPRLMKACHLRSALLLDFFQPFLKTIRHSKEPMHEKMQILSIIYSILEIKLLIKSIKLKKISQHDFCREYLIYLYKILNQKFNTIQSFELRKKVLIYIRNIDKQQLANLFWEKKILFKKDLLFEEKPCDFCPLFLSQGTLE